MSCITTLKLINPMFMFYFSCLETRVSKMPPFNEWLQRGTAPIFKNKEPCWNHRNQNLGTSCITCNGYVQPQHGHFGAGIGGSVRYLFRHCKGAGANWRASWSHWLASLTEPPSPSSLLLLWKETVQSLLQWWRKVGQCCWGWFSCFLFPATSIFLLGLDIYKKVIDFGSLQKIKMLLFHS